MTDIIPLKKEQKNQEIVYMDKNKETFTIDVSYMTDEEHKKLLKKIKEYFENHKDAISFKK